MTMTEPSLGSIILIHEPTGTAAQRWYSDGLWHTTNGHTMTWEGACIIDMRPPIVVYDPEVMPAQPRNEVEDAFDHGWSAALHEVVEHQEAAARSSRDFGRGYAYAISVLRGEA